MKIALIGYGKMGKTIERSAQQRGHEIILRIGSKDMVSDATLSTADAVIEFTQPEAAPGNVRRCLRLGIPVVSGTTGWNDLLDAVKRDAEQQGGAMIQASNFSIGVNIFFEINKILARMMAGQNSYKVLMEEVHHTEKLDAPSGTAITLAESILDEMPQLNGWALSDKAASGQLPVTALRKEGVPGTHTVSYASAVDDISLTHTAHSRDGFALGAVMAAEFLQGKMGVFEMKDVLGIL